MKIKSYKIKFIEKEIELTIFLFLFFFTLSDLFSQNVKDSSVVKDDVSYVKLMKINQMVQLSQYQIAYSMAISNQDYASAISTVYNIMAVEPNNLLTLMAWKDSLCKLYFNANDYTQCIAAGRDYLKNAAPGNSVRNVSILALIAFSEKNLNNWKEALNTFEEVYPKSHSTYHLYQVAELQYLLKRYAECEITIDTLIKKTDITTVIPVASGIQGQAQSVPFKAASMNLKGIMLFDLNKRMEATACFQEAIKIFPDFILAKENLKMAAKIETPAVKK